MDGWSKKDIAAWDQVSTLDLKLVRKSLENEIRNNRALKKLAGKSVENFARHAENAYRRFLFVCLKRPGEVVVPDQKIDAFWHKHILFTEHYTETCQALFGGYLHHRPDPAAVRSGKRKGTGAAYRKTKKMYFEIFGSLSHGKEQQCTNGAGSPAPCEVTEPEHPHGGRG